MNYVLKERKEEERKGAGGKRMDGRKTEEKDGWKGGEKTRGSFEGMKEEKEGGRRQEREEGKEAGD